MVQLIIFDEGHNIDGVAHEIARFVYNRMPPPLMLSVVKSVRNILMLLYIVSKTNTWDQWGYIKTYFHFIKVSKAEVYRQMHDILKNLSESLINILLKESLDTKVSWNVNIRNESCFKILRTKEFRKILPCKGDELMHKLENFCEHLKSVRAFNRMMRDDI